MNTSRLILKSQCNINPHMKCSIGEQMLGHYKHPLHKHNKQVPEMDTAEYHESGVPAFSPLGQLWVRVLLLKEASSQRDLRSANMNIMTPVILAEITFTFVKCRQASFKLLSNAHKCFELIL